LITNVPAFAGVSAFTTISILSAFIKVIWQILIALRWALRDIKAKRVKLSPVSESDMATLTDLGLVEMQDDVPVLTPAGHDALD
jgi:hypothetical protein